MTEKTMSEIQSYLSERMPQEACVHLDKKTGKCKREGFTCWHPEEVICTAYNDGGPSVFG